MNTATTWVLVGNGSEAKLFESQNIGREIHLLQEFEHPESREKGIELASDKVGHYESNNGVGHGSFVEPSEPKEFEVVKFARELANILEVGRVSNKYQRLIIIMPSHAQGILKKEVNHHVSNLVIHQIDKDYTKKTEKDLLVILDELPRF